MRFVLKCCAHAHILPCPAPTQVTPPSIPVLPPNSNTPSSFRSFSSIASNSAANSGGSAAIASHNSASMPSSVYSLVPPPSAAYPSAPPPPLAASAPSNGHHPSAMPSAPALPAASTAPPARSSVPTASRELHTPPPTAVISFAGAAGGTGGGGGSQPPVQESLSHWLPRSGEAGAPAAAMGGQSLAGQQPSSVAGGGSGVGRPVSPSGRGGGMIFNGGGGGAVTTLGARGGLLNETVFKVCYGQTLPGGPGVSVSATRKKRGTNHNVQGTTTFCQLSWARPGMEPGLKRRRATAQRWGFKPRLGKGMFYRVGSSLLSKDSCSRCAHAQTLVIWGAFQ